MDLNAIWFIIVIVLFTGYAVLDGFDLGCGPLLLLVKEDTDRRLVLNAIGPVWNGNEVWLVTGGGALFAAFPEVYATVFSGFYDAFMLLLFALIFRAVAIEVRGKRAGRRWRRGWDVAFAIASTSGALLIGIAIGNLVWGIPLDARGEFQGDLGTLLHPYPLLVGVVVVSLMAMHANLYLILKTEGPLRERLVRWSKRTVPLYLAAFVALNATTLLFCEHVRQAAETRAIPLALIGLVAVLATLNIPRELRRGNEGRAFLSSCASIVFMMALFAVTLFPRLVVSRPNIGYSLDIHNGASTSKTLGFMLVVALIGMPLVLAYTISIYYVFRGKVRLTQESY